MSEQTNRPKVLIHCLHRSLGLKIAERLLRDQFHVELNYECNPHKVAQSLQNCDVAIFEVGARRENIELFPLKQTGGTVPPRQYPLIYALLEKNQNIKFAREVLHIDQIYSLPLDLTLMSDDITSLLRLRGIAVARKHTRSKVNLDITLRVLLPANEIRMRATNLSMGGFFAEGKLGAFSKGVGDQVNFIFHQGTSHHPPIKGTGTVKWVHTGPRDQKILGAGISFSSLYGVSERELRAFIGRHQQNEWVLTNT